MTDREKLVEMLLISSKTIEEEEAERIANYMISHGVTVREPQKPCKFEEISLHSYCWIEYKYEFYASIEIACAFYKTSEYCRIDLIGHCSSTAHRKELYNKTWRIWNEKPTEEERKNAKWEE